MCVVKIFRLTLAHVDRTGYEMSQKMRELYVRSMKWESFDFMCFDLVFYDIFISFFIHNVRSSMDGVEIRKSKSRRCARAHSIASHHRTYWKSCPKLIEISRASDWIMFLISQFSSRLVRRFDGLIAKKSINGNSIFHRLIANSWKRDFSFRLIAV